MRPAAGIPWPPPLQTTFARQGSSQTGLVTRESGLFGSVTARAEAQVLRLSVLYAVMDGSDAIKLSHLEAAVAVWEYAEASARYIFGDATGDPVADRILTALRNGEMTRTAISYLFQKNVPATRLQQALNLLLSAKLARFEIQVGNGKPVEVWMVV